MSIFALLLPLLFLLPGVAGASEAILTDFRIIEKAADWPTSTIGIGNTKKSGASTVTILCSKNKITLVTDPQRNSSGEIIHSEQSAVLYYGLHKLGFLFPHPRKQISPSLKEARKHCGKTYTWKPRLKYRGMHLHTQHPSEWVEGFFMGKKAMAEDMVRWSARNMQNILQVQMIRVPLRKLKHYFKRPIALAHSLGVEVGLSFSFALQQQKSFKMIPLFNSLTGIGDLQALTSNLHKVIDAFDADFFTFELGTSEFTSTKYKRTIKWMNRAQSILGMKNKKMFIKVHVSSNQHHPKYGNFNFLPEKAHPEVGVLPHTVMFYGLEDEQTPMYGQKNFKDILDFMKRNVSQRPTWYYPETSYYIAMDIDLPLFLTDYLVARSNDMDLLQKIGVEGQVNFTTGHELGYWLFDWTVALLANSEYAGQPKIGLKLLGENPEVWQKIIDFQNTHIKKAQLIQPLSSSNFQDEIPVLGMIHDRTLLRQFDGQPLKLGREIRQLELAITQRPVLDEVQSEELKIMLQVTWNRFDHAYALRQALKHRGQKALFKNYLSQAKIVRKASQRLINNYISKYNRYPEGHIFKSFKNPTSYQFGYGWTAKKLHYWLREEEIVAKDRVNPFFMNVLYDPFRLLL